MAAVQSPSLERVRAVQPGAHVDRGRRGDRVHAPAAGRGRAPLELRSGRGGAAACGALSSLRVRVRLWVHKDTQRLLLV